MKKAMLAFSLAMMIFSIAGAENRDILSDRIQGSQILVNNALMGVVTDSALNPVQDVIVSLFFGPRFDTTDTAGQFSFEETQADVNRLVFSHHDYFDTVIYDIQVPDNDTVILNIVMRRRPANDVGIGSIRPMYLIPELIECPVSAFVVNFGLEPQSFDIIYEIRQVGTTEIVAADTTQVSDIPGNSLDTVTFERQFIPAMESLNTSYSILVYSLLVGDENPANDSMISIVRIFHEYHIIYGNKDGSPLTAPAGGIIEIPAWGVTPIGNNQDSITFMHIPLSTNDSVITSRLGGYFPDTLVGRWDDVSFLLPGPDTTSGWTNQSMLGFATLSDPPDNQNWFWTGGDTVIICTFRMQVRDDMSLAGDTLHPFREGFNMTYSGLHWEPQILQAIIPRATYPDLILQGSELCDYIAGDINNDLSANGLDIVYAVNYLKGGPPPPNSCDLCPQAPFFAAGDVNATCNFNGLDVTYYVSYLKGGPSLQNCPTCRPSLK